MTLKCLMWKKFTSLTRKRTPRSPGRARAIKDRYGPNWRAVKKSVLDRDDHRCSQCGGTYRISVHHKRKIALFYDPETDSIDYEAANDPSNLVTLCDKCHKAADGHTPLQGFSML